ncbi:MAG: EamA family transporter RarD [Arcobacter sp.]|nr:EamA family transporter RarD [Arcobacter sp.]
MSEIRLGQLYAVLAFLFWGGISPIYFKQVSTVDSFEVLIYRVLFSFLTLLPFLFLKKEFQSFILTIKDMRKVKYLFFSTIFASTNWLIFIWAISNNQIMEASLGYYINPLVNVFLGYLIFNERMTKNQYIAIFIAVLAILYQFFAIGSIPIISLALAFSFGLYGMLRKKVNVGSIVGLFIEIIILFPFALIYIYYVYKTQGIAFLQNSDNYVSFMLVLSGLITVIPLLLFNGAARRMKLTTLGFFQYIGPSVAFFIALYIYNEEFSFDKLVTFVLIWIALVIFSLDSFIKNKNNKIKS